MSFMLTLLLKQTYMFCYARLSLPGLTRERRYWPGISGLV